MTDTPHATPADSSWWPTRKWIAALVTAVAALLVNWADTGEWNKTLTIAAIGVVAQALVSYLVPNQATATMTGVPARRR